MRKPILCSFAALMIATLVGGMLAGCAPRAHLTPQTTATIEQHHQEAAIETEEVADQAEVEIAQVQSKAAVKQVQGQTSPSRHPIAAANNVVRELHPWLIAVELVSGLLWAVAFGLSFTPFRFLNFLKPVFLSILSLCTVALFLLPLVPWILGLAIAAIVGLLVYMLVKDRGNVTQAIHDSEQLLGIESKTAAPPLVAPGSQAPSPDPTSAAAVPGAGPGVTMMPAVAPVQAA